MTLFVAGLHAFALNGKRGREDCSPRIGVYVPAIALYFVISLRVISTPFISFVGKVTVSLLILTELRTVRVRLPNINQSNLCGNGVRLTKTMRYLERIWPRHLALG